MAPVLSALDDEAHPAGLSRPYRDALIIAAAVLAAAMFGILSRPVGFLATVWPANALLLGLMVRNRNFAAPHCWAIAALALIAADLISGSTLALAFWMTFANLSGVVVGYLLFSRLSADDKALLRPLSVLYLLIIAIAAGVTAGLVGCGVEAFLFDRNLLVTWFSWFGSELVSYVAILPVVLTAPARFNVAGHFGNFGRKKANSSDLGRIFLLKFGPALSLGLSLAASWFIGGPGALAFPVPALLWCALTYSLFVTSLATLLVSMWTMASISIGGFGFPPSPQDAHLFNSVRLGATLLALGPITVASVTAAREELLKKLKRTATHDHLTDALTRSAFTRAGSNLLNQLLTQERSVAVIMCDIDRFKGINDNFGHAVGDTVLITFAQVVKDQLRPNDIFGRLGGDEFAIILSDMTIDTTTEIIGRIQKTFASIAHLSDAGRPLSVTASFGGVVAAAGASELANLLAAADEVLYSAKAAGRNRVFVRSYPLRARVEEGEEISEVGTDIVFQ